MMEILKRKGENQIANARSGEQDTSVCLYTIKVWHNASTHTHTAKSKIEK